MKTILENLVKEVDFKSNQLSGLVWLKDGNGFSIIKEYPQKIIKRLKVIGDEKYVAFIKFIVYQAEKDDKLPIVPIIWFAYHDVKDTKEYYFHKSRYVKKKSFIPIDFYFSDEFYLDQKEKKLYRKKHEKYFPTNFTDILNYIFEHHINASSFIYRIFFFIRKSFFRLLSYFCTGFYHVFKFILWLVFGDSFNYEYFIEKYYPNNKIQKDQNDFSDERIKVPAIKFMDYSIPIPKLIRFILLQFMIIAVLYFLGKKVFLEKFLFSSTSVLIVTFYLIIAFFIFNYCLPFFLKILIKFFSFARFKTNIRS